MIQHGFFILGEGGGCLRCFFLDTIVVKVDGWITLKLMMNSELKPRAPLGQEYGVFVAG